MTDRSRLSALGARLSAPDDQLPQISQISQSPQMLRLRLLRLAAVVAERRELMAESRAPNAEHVASGGLK